MPRRIHRHPKDSGTSPGERVLRFSQPLVSDMAAYLSKRLGRFVSMEEADEALGGLTDYARILLAHRKDFQ
jgi:hypothetical protein